MLDPEESTELPSAIPSDSEVRQVLDAFPSLVILVDAEHRIVLANKAVADAAGASAIDLEGQRCTRVLHGIDGVFPGCPLEEAVGTGLAVEREVRVDGTDEWISSAVYPTNYVTESGGKVYLHVARDISGRKKAETGLQSALKVQQILTELLSIAMEVPDLKDFLQAALERVLQIPWLTVEKKGAVFLVEPGGRRLRMVASVDLAPLLLDRCSTIDFGICMCGKAAEEGRLQYSGSLDERHDVFFDGMSEHGHYCVPIMSMGEVLGVLNFYLVPEHPPNPDEIAFLTSVSDLVAGVIHRRDAERGLREALVQMQQNLDATVQVISGAMAVRDPYTAGHMERVTSLAVAIASDMGLREDQIEAVKMAASLHDIGKVQVPAEILAKPGQLSAAEFAIIQGHSETGHDLLKGLPFSFPIATIVCEHHEKLDGTGYPNGLKGDEISLEGRIIAVADVVEAVASDRPYRPALGLEKALEIIEKGRGRQFDEAAVDSCLDLIRTQGFEF